MWSQLHIFLLPRWNPVWIHGVLVDWSCVLVVLTHQYEGNRQFHFASKLQKLTVWQFFHSCLTLHLYRKERKLGHVGSDLKKGHTLITNFKETLCMSVSRHCWSSSGSEASAEPWRDETWRFSNSYQTEDRHLLLCTLNFFQSLVREVKAYFFFGLEKSCFKKQETSSYCYLPKHGRSTTDIWVTQTSPDDEPRKAPLWRVTSEGNRWLIGPTTEYLTFQVWTPLWCINVFFSGSLCGIVKLAFSF